MKKARVNEFFRKLTIATAIMALLALVAAFVPYRAYESAERTQCSKYTSGWILDEKKIVDLDDMRFTKKDHLPDYTLKKKLPDLMSDNQELMLVSQHVDFTVYLDNKMIYNYQPKVPRLAGKTYGQKVHFVNLGEGSNSKELRILVYATYRDRSGLLTNVYIGSSGSYIAKNVRETIFPFILSLFGIFLSALIFVLSKSLPKDDRQGYSMKFLSIMGVTGSIWVMFESNMLIYIVRRGIMSENTKVFMMIFASFAATAFVHEFYEVRKNIPIYITIFVNLLTVVFLIASSMIGYKDYHEYLPLVQVIMIFECFYISYVIARRTVFSKSKSYRRKTWFMPVGFLCLILSVFFSIFRYVEVGTTTSNSSRLMGVTVSIMLVVMAKHYNMQINRNTKKAIKADAFERMAYTDELTGIENRAAYYREEMKLKDLVDNGKSEGVIIVNMDLNNLKMVNDVYGHDRGDQYLKSASEVLRRTFDNWGHVFRIGGDEFIALVQFDKFDDGSIEENQHFLMSTLERNQELIGRRDGWENELSIAYGVSLYRNGDSISFDEAKKRADKAMYKMKSRMKRIRRF